MGLFPVKTTVKMPACQSVSVKDVDQQVVTKALAAFLKKSGKVKLPEWVDIVKTNVAKELAPTMKIGTTPDWLQWPDTSMSGLLLESALSARSTEFVAITEVPPAIGVQDPVPWLARDSN